MHMEMHHWASPLHENEQLIEYRHFWIRIFCILNENRNVRWNGI